MTLSGARRRGSFQCAMVVSSPTFEYAKSVRWTNQNQTCLLRFKCMT